MLPRDTSTEGFSRRTGEEVQKGCDPRDRGWSERRIHD